MNESTNYRLALILPQSRQLLGHRQGTGDFELPEISVPNWARPAEAITSIIAEQWQFKTIVLDVFYDSKKTAPCAVVEVIGICSGVLPHELAALGSEYLSAEFLGDCTESSLRNILAGGDAGRGHFARLGWIEEARAWIQGASDAIPIILSGETRQLNASGQFSLVRFATVKGPALWMKAVGGANAHEFNVTMFLATHCPQHLPRIVAKREDWNAWLMEEVGSSLHSSSTLRNFEIAVSTLASIQVDLLGKSKELLAARCGDHRLSTLRSRLDEIAAYLSEVMALQTSTKAPKLSNARIDELRVLLDRSCLALEGVGLPDSILHNDISPGSILCDQGHCAITDWCEAHVGNPFITFEQLSMHAARRADNPAIWVKQLRSIYKAAWLNLLDETQIEKAFLLSPLISVLSYLYGRGDWLSSPRRHLGQFQTYARSLTRHMDRIASDRRLLEAL